MSGQKTWIQHARLVTEDGVLEDASLLLENGRIAEYGNHLDFPYLSNGESIDAMGGWLLPGFIDVHVHGGFGYDFIDATRESIDGVTRFHAENGTTSMLATTVTAPPETLERVLYAVSEYQSSSMPYAQLLGVHLEGPFISSKWPGAQNPEYIVPPQLNWLQQWTARFPSLIRMLTLAPETDGALEVIEWVSRHGITAAAGHTDAGYDEMQKAVKHGLRHAVHTFNAMKGMHHREPGTVGAVLNTDAISAEIIADGVHVHPAVISILTRMKNKDNLLLITDAISAAGLGDGDYSLGGLDVVVTDGVATLKEGSSLAGSTLTMIRAFRFMVDMIGMDVPAVSRLASGNPARLLGIHHQTGSIAVGKQADILLLTPDLNLQQIWIGGRALLPPPKQSTE